MECVLYLYLFLCFKIISNKLYAKWTDPKTKAHYDFSRLVKANNAPYVVADSYSEGNYTLKYFINIADYNSQKCNDMQGSVIEILYKDNVRTPVCEVLGKYDDYEINLLDKNNPSLGIYLLYQGGELCDNNFDLYYKQPRRVRLKLYCDIKNSNESFVLDYANSTQGYTKCLLDFKMHSKYACPLNYERKYLKIIILMFIFIALISFFKFKSMNNRNKHLY